MKVKCIFKRTIHKIFKKKITDRPLCPKTLETYIVSEHWVSGPATYRGFDAAQSKGQIGDDSFIGLEDGTPLVIDRAYVSLGFGSYSLSLYLTEDPIATPDNLNHFEAIEYNGLRFLRSDAITNTAGTERFWSWTNSLAEDLYNSLTTNNETVPFIVD